MVATNEKVQFDFNADFGDSNYKSCFARSVVVNSQFHSKSLDLRQLQKVNRDGQDKRNTVNNSSQPEIICSTPNDVFKLRKDSPPLPSLPPPSPPHDEMGLRRMSCSSSSGLSGAASGSGGRLSRRISELPVEQLQLHSHIDTLHWQLKQAESSRQMYRAVLQQVASFLERAHRSLATLGERQHPVAGAGVQRSRSEFHVAQPDSTTGIGSPDHSADNSSPFRDYSTWEAIEIYKNKNNMNNWEGSELNKTWLPLIKKLRRPKRQQTGPDEIPPEKLSQEAFRLLRTAQSLLNTREPDLAHVSPDIHPKDQEFLSQLAREFPSRPQRATSFSVNPQLISPSDREIRISTAFNRKLSLQRTPVNELRRDSLRQEMSKKEVSRNLENDYCLMNITSNELDANESKRSSVTSIPSSVKKNAEKAFFDGVLNGDKAPSPKTGSVSSAEDESGFSSMNSFQEVGLPLIHSTLTDNEALFKNGDLSVNSSDSNITQIDVLHSETKALDKSKLIWNRSDLGLPITHRRWSSTPVEVAQNDPLKVLWV